MVNLADFPGCCVRHLQNGGLRVQATTKVGGVDLCAPCSRARDVVAGQAKGSDGTLAGRRFHKHAKNCAWCLKVIEAGAGTKAASPLKLCPEGRKLWLEAYEEAQAGAAQA